MVTQLRTIWFFFSKHFNAFRTNRSTPVSQWSIWLIRSHPEQSEMRWWRGTTWVRRTCSTMQSKYLQALRLLIHKLLIWHKTNRKLLSLFRSQVRNLDGSQDWCQGVRAARWPGGGQPQDGDDCVRLLDGEKSEKVKAWLVPIIIYYPEYGMAYLFDGLFDV